jgi:anti-sigma B factor antagonist
MKPRPDVRPSLPAGSAAADSFVIRKRVTRADGSVALVLDGHLDVDGSPVLQNALSEVLRQGIRQVELDCRQVRFISSVGVGVLIVAVGEFREVGGDVAIAGLNDEMLQMFRMLELTDYVTLK